MLFQEESAKIRTFSEIEPHRLSEIAELNGIGKEAFSEHRKIKKELP